MNTDQIFYLLDIDRTHSITQTAQRFFMSQQALSFSIKKLEHEFNCTFVERSNQGAYLTNAGYDFLKEMKPLAERYTILKKKLAIDQQRLDSYKNLTGHVVIEAHVRTVGPLVLDILDQFKELCPKSTYILREKENIEIIDDVIRGDTHIGIIFVPEYIIDETNKLLAPAEITIKKLFTDDFVICAHRNHPIFKRNNLSFSDVSLFDAVLFDSHAKMNVANAPSMSSSSSVNQIFSKDISLHKKLLLEGKAVSCVTTFEFKKVYKEIKELTIAHLINTMTSNITLVLPPNKATLPEVNVLQKLLEQFDFASI